jgi:hypothetical protein
VVVVRLPDPLRERAADIPEARANVEIGEYASLVEIFVDRVIIPVQVFE